MRRGFEVFRRLQGPVATLPICFTEEDEVHFSAMCRYVNWLADQNVSSILLTYGYSQFSWLSDYDIWRLTADLAETIAGRSIFIASTGWWPPKECRKFLKHADRAGVDTVKIQINPWPIMNVNPEKKGEFFCEFINRIRDAAPIPLTLWCNYFNTAAVPVKVIAEMAKDTQIVACKNDDHPFYYYYDLIRATKDTNFAVISGGSMRNFVFGYQIGSPAYLCDVVDFRPDIPLKLHALLKDHRVAEAWELVYRYEEPQYKIALSFGWDRWIHAVLEMYGLFPNRIPAGFEKPLSVAEYQDLQKKMENLYGSIERIAL